MTFSLAHVAAIRQAEIEFAIKWFEPGARILEIGAGTGQQSKVLASRGFDVSAIDLPHSRYSEDREFPVIDYDGAHIPFPDRSFDIVYSSNVLEHVPYPPRLHKEIRRVLRPGGYAVHAMPTPVWRFWTTFAERPFDFSPHGERGNAWAELWLFRSAWWRRHFHENGFAVLRDAPMGLFYTGRMRFGLRWSIRKRAWLARILGSSCHLYEVAVA